MGTFCPGRKYLAAAAAKSPCKTPQGKTPEGTVGTDPTLSLPLFGKPVAGGGVRFFLPAAGLTAVPLLQGDIAVFPRTDVVPVKVSALGTGLRNFFL